MFVCHRRGHRHLRFQLAPVETWALLIAERLVSVPEQRSATYSRLSQNCEKHPCTEFEEAGRIATTKSASIRRPPDSRDSGTMRLLAR
jgi:hypothetical protein